MKLKLAFCSPSCPWATPFLFSASTYCHRTGKTVLNMCRYAHLVISFKWKKTMVLCLRVLGAACHCLTPMHPFIEHLQLTS